MHPFSSALIPSPKGVLAVLTVLPSFSNWEVTVVSEAVSSILKFDISPPREEELSSSPLIDVAGDASTGDSDLSVSSTTCCRLQNIMLAVRVRSIFWFTCHNITNRLIEIVSTKIKRLIEIVKVMKLYEPHTAYCSFGKKKKKKLLLTAPKLCTIFSVFVNFKCGRVFLYFSK